MLSCAHLYTHYVRGMPVNTKLVIGDTMIVHSHRTGKNHVLRFATSEVHEDGTRTGVFLTV